MRATTRWQDKKTNDIDEAIELLTDTVEQDGKKSLITWDNWKVCKSYETNQMMRLDDRDIEYNYVRYSFDQISTDRYTSEERVVRKEGFIIPYKDNASIYYILDQNTYARKLLRRLLSYNGKNDIENCSFDFLSDFYTWIFYRTYEHRDEIELQKRGNPVLISAIKGYKGDTPDSQTKVSASGESVMTSMSTFSFLVEGNKFSQIKINLEYKDHENLQLELQSGSVNAPLNNYIGILDHEDQLDSKIAKLYLTIYLEVLPILLHGYEADKKNELWGMKTNKQFIRSVADKLRDNVDKLR